MRKKHTKRNTLKQSYSVKKKLEKVGRIFFKFCYGKHTWIYQKETTFQKIGTKIVKIYWPL